MNQNELSYFRIEGAIGGNQSWMRDIMMYMGGCAAITACDLSIYLAKNHNRPILYPFDRNALTKKDFLQFSRIMKRFLGPRMRGIDRLDIYIDGYQSYLDYIGADYVSIAGLSGHESLQSAKDAVIEAIDRNIPVPYLLLKHKNPSFEDLVWHWFILGGYRKSRSELQVKIITYGHSYWVSLDALWDTGYAEKGGLIVVDTVAAPTP